MNSEWRFQILSLLMSGLNSNSVNIARIEDQLKEFERMLQGAPKKEPARVKKQTVAELPVDEPEVEV